MRTPGPSEAFVCIRPSLGHAVGCLRDDEAHLGAWRLRNAGCLSGGPHGPEQGLEPELNFEDALGSC